jgi:hypothetical protein
MLRSSLSALAGLLLLSSLSVGCIGGGDLVADETDVATDELSLRGWEPLIGAWVGSTGPFEGLVITRTIVGQGRHFFADVDTGIRCITTPCPSPAHLEGRVTAGTRNLTFRHPDRPSPEAAPFYGTYAYTLNGSTLTLAQNGRIVARLRKATSYCSDADQCAEQRLITPRCLGRFECESNACRYRCGQPPLPTCASTTCAPGTLCVEGVEGAHCITACATVRCSGGNVCVADARGARCVPSTCANTPTACPAGEMCVDGDAGPRCITRCAAVRCASGTTCVADAAGVRCEPTGVRCGTTTCGAGLVCCNPLRNICTRPGMFCIQ